jgi:hypothetical protein
LNNQGHIAINRPIHVHVRKRTVFRLWRRLLPLKDRQEEAQRRSCKTERSLEHTGS